MGSRFDDCIYGTPLLQLHLIITVHTLNSFLITNLSLYFFWFSDWSLVSNLVFSRCPNLVGTEYRTPSRTVDSSLILCCHETCVNSFIREQCLPSRYLATDVSVVFLWLRTSDFQASCHNILDNIMGAIFRVNVFGFCKQTYIYI
jgi:hypothetical protein